MQCYAHLNGQDIAYILKRCQRKSIGLKIDRFGLIVSIPLKAPIPRVESVLQDKAGWITRKLEQWKNKKTIEPVWSDRASYPLLGEPWQIAISTSGEVHMAPLSAEETGTTLTSHQREKFVMAWYHRQAITHFKERLIVYAEKLGVPCPPFRLSRAKTRWGSCNAHGIIHLNWRLIQMPPHLVDYVIAHELSHLIEMNHSAAFWKQVESVYPEYLMARKELKEYG